MSSQSKENIKIVLGRKTRSDLLFKICISSRSACPNAVLFCDATAAEQLQYNPYSEAGYFVLVSCFAACFVSYFYLCAEDTAYDATGKDKKTIEARLAELLSRILVRRWFRL